MRLAARQVVRLAALDVGKAARRELHRSCDPSLSPVTRTAMAIRVVIAGPLRHRSRDRHAVALSEFVGTDCHVREVGGRAKRKPGRVASASLVELPQLVRGDEGPTRNSAR